MSDNTHNKEKVSPFDETLEWALSLNKTRRIANSFFTIKVIGCIVVVIIIILIVWMIIDFLTKKPTDKENKKRSSSPVSRMNNPQYHDNTSPFTPLPSKVKYIDADTGAPVSIDEVKTGNYEDITEKLSP